ncbi:hypothetical protein [Croceicoccus gelatinilyticus]|uniref:hypothetical protein n=1 Tax=Croceicoccus gelatinilyticus TaxID=2835536 RepID=UPI001BD15A26|nr:hypothetical protein [Croceicoccus gelatinilyticus]MBS7670472.1 hypothetical protein [Croceicoccus gelatinilyticus]
MPFEPRPDGSLKLAMHQPLYQVIVVILVAFGIGGFFLYGLVYSEETGLVVKGYDTGYDLPIWLWRAGFLAGSVVGFGVGLFILLGLVRGNQPHVRLEPQRLVVAGFAMRGDTAMRWDEVESVKRFRIMHDDAITLKAKSGKKLQLSGHVFPHKGDFQALMAEIDSRIAAART